MQVVRTFVHEKYVLIHLYTNEQKIETTEEHLFWVEGTGWTYAGDLKEGDRLRLKNGECQEVTGFERIELESPVTVYNLEVADWHTYFVSDEEILVHNYCSATVPKGIDDAKIYFGQKSVAPNFSATGRFK